MSPKKPKLLYHFIFDDFRRELHNKVSLMGIHIGQEIILEDIPILLPSLCFHLVFSNISNGDIFVMNILNPNDKKILSFEPPPIKISKDQLDQNCVINLVATGLKIDKEGLYKFEIIHNNKELDEFNIHFQKKK